MRTDFVPEPELQFGSARHVDIRFGLMNYGPFDFDEDLSPKRIKVGIVGTTETVEGLQIWLERCRRGIPAKQSRQPNLFPRFPGFGVDTMLPADLFTDPLLQRTVKHADVDRVCRQGKLSEITSQAVDQFLAEFQNLAEKGGSDVFLFAPPMNLVQKMIGSTESEEDEEKDESEQQEVLDFHDLLKSKVMRFGKPIQIILPMTYDSTKRLKRKTSRSEMAKVLQDEATRAWNLYTALYYKAGGTPWRLVHDSSQLTTLFIGVSFYKTRDMQKLVASTAQVFNERGEGIILRGGFAAISKEDRQPHLDEKASYSIIDAALKAYRNEHHTVPARIVIQKTSSYTTAELAGSEAAIKAHNVDCADILTIGRSGTRLFRHGAYPPLRGTLLCKDETTHVFYTRGSVDFFATYPGLYVPRPLLFRCEKTEQTPNFLAREILALTKMNWNNTQFDNRDPINVLAARKVGRILKYVKENEVIQPRYSFYM